MPIDLGRLRSHSIAARILHDLRHRQVRGEFLPDCDRPGARPATAVGGAEGFVGVVVHDVHPEIAGPGDAEDGVHVGAVEIEQRAGFVDELGHFDDVAVELADGVGVGHHHRGDLVVELGLEVFQIGHAIGPRFDVYHAGSAHGAARGVGAVGRVGGEHDAALRLAVVLEISPDHLEGRPFPMCPGAGLERHLIEPGDFL